MEIDCVKCSKAETFMQVAKVIDEKMALEFRFNEFSNDE